MRTVKERYPGVTIDSGPVSPTARPGEIGPERWPELVRVRRDFARTQLRN